MKVNHETSVTWADLVRVNLNEERNPPIIKPPQLGTDKIALGRFTEQGFEWIPKKEEQANREHDAFDGRRCLITRVG